MDIRFDQENDIIIVALYGKLESSSTENLRFELEQYLDVSELKMLFDLHGVDYISSEGMQVLQLLAKSIKDNHGEIIFCNIPEYIRESFDITGFNQLFKIVDSKEEAITLLSGLIY